MKKHVDGEKAALVSDGWSNLHNEPVIATCLQVKGKTFFLDSQGTGAMTKDADNCKALTQQKTWRRCGQP
jgi:hypothetical protein